MSCIVSFVSFLYSSESINLSNNRLTGAIPTQLGRLTQLDTLFLMDNDLSGTIPSEIGKIKNLKGLYLDRNKLQGSIPAQLFDFTALKYLHLNENKITGIILSTIGQASGLWGRKFLLLPLIVSNVDKIAITVFPSFF